MIVTGPESRRAGSEWCNQGRKSILERGRQGDRRHGRDVAGREREGMAEMGDRGARDR